MKKVLVCMLAVGLAATAADAAMLRMNFQAGAADANTVVTGQQAVVELWMDTVANDVFSAIGVRLEAQPLVEQDAHSWAFGVDGSNGDGPVGTGDWGANYPVPNNFAPGIASTLLGTMTFSSATPGVYDLAFDTEALSLLTATGAMYTWGPNFVGVVPNFYGYGDFGSSGVDDLGLGGSVRHALVLTVVPEPASLALLAFGGFAALRRRR